MDKNEIEIYKWYKKLCKDYKNPLVGDFNTEPKKVNLSEIIDLYDVFCFDGFGTLYNRGNFVYEGAKKWIQKIREAGKEIRLVTNAASNTDDFLAEEANIRGFDFKKEETISSGSLLKDLNEGSPVGIFSDGRFLEKRIKEVYYIGRDTGKNVLLNSHIVPVDNPSEPVVAISSYTATDDMYEQSLEILKKPGGLLLALNPDAWAPEINGTRIPVSGTLAYKLFLNSNCRVCYLGKPFYPIWEKVKRSVPLNSRIIMIGDTLGTDILGALVAGIHSALVLGRNVLSSECKEDELILGIKPSYYLEPD